MPYSHAIVQKCLATIHSISPEIELVRTEIFLAKGTVPMQRFTVVRANGRMDLQAPQSSRPSDEDQQQLREYLAISPDQVATLVTQLFNLYSINHYGTWVVSPAPAPAVVVGGESRSLIDGDPSVLTRVHASLLDALPGVHEIRVEACLNMVGSSGMRRRPCIRAMESDEIELAAIDATLFPMHLQALLLPREFSKSHHRCRVAAWATQLGTGVDQLAEVLVNLGLLAVSLPVTRVVLHPLTETSAYWKSRGLRR